MVSTDEDLTSVDTELTDRNELNHPRRLLNLSPDRYEYIRFQTQFTMKSSVRLCMAVPTAAGSTRGLKPAPMALLPPIPLYRRILRTHRKKLDRTMRVLGDEYVKSEFRAHRNVENPAHIVSLQVIAVNGSWLTHSLSQIGFLTEWQMYAQQLEGDTWRGEKLDSGKIDKMSGKCQLTMVLLREQGADHCNRSAAWAALRTDAGYPERRARGR